MYVFGGVIVDRVNCISKGRVNCSEVLIKLVSNIEFVSIDFIIFYDFRRVV